MLLATGSTLAQISVGIRIGPPPPPRVVAVRRVAPGPGYYWVEGYWYPQGKRYRWHDGYWTLPPYEGALWVMPRYENGFFLEGYWSGPRYQHFDHDHRWDRQRDRDRGRWRDNYNHDRDHDRGRR
jgi:YXWGXW repeat-containing protein